MAVYAYETAALADADAPEPVAWAVCSASADGMLTGTPTDWQSCGSESFS